MTATQIRETDHRRYTLWTSTGGEERAVIVTADALDALDDELGTKLAVDDGLIDFSLPVALYPGEVASLQIRYPWLAMVRADGPTIIEFARLWDTHDIAIQCERCRETWAVMRDLNIDNWCSACVDEAEGYDAAEPWMD